jgi:hypothetical protein
MCKKKQEKNKRGRIPLRGRGLTKLKELARTGEDDNGDSTIADDADLACLLDDPILPLGDSHLAVARVLYALYLDLPLPPLCAFSAADLISPLREEPEIERKEEEEEEEERN